MDRKFVFSKALEGGGEMNVMRKELNCNLDSETRRKVRAELERAFKPYEISEVIRSELRQFTVPAIRRIVRSDDQSSVEGVALDKPKKDDNCITIPADKGRTTVAGFVLREIPLCEFLEIPTIVTKKGELNKYPIPSTRQRILHCDHEKTRLS